MSTKNCYLGIECGGSRTTAILSNEKMDILKKVPSGPANLRLLDDKQLNDLFNHLSNEFPHPSAIGIRMAGVRNDMDKKRVKDVIDRMWPGIHSWIGNDLDAAMEASTLCSKSSAATRIIVVSGTGSCVIGRTPKGRMVKVGGRGHILGDRGSGYDIALRAIKLCLQEHDRTGKWPHLGQKILRCLILNEPDELIDWIKDASKDTVAAVAKDVIMAWEKRDPLAKRVIFKTVAILSEDIVNCAKRLCATKKKLEIFLNGGVWTNHKTISCQMKRKLAALLPLASVSVLSVEGAWGAVRMALKCPKVEANNRKVPSPHLLPIPMDIPVTETRNPKSMQLDKMPLNSAIQLMLEEDLEVPKLLLKHKTQIAQAVSIISQSLNAGGHLFYIGAGTSGRLGILDASECPPTFQTPPDMVQGIIAGGQRALWTSIEGAEDSFESGREAVIHRGVSTGDIAIGISACGKTPFVWGAIKCAMERGARTIFLSFNPRIKIPRSIKPHLAIMINLGPEVLTGSTRLKAGTATKLILNVFSTLSMVHLGRVVSNLMTDLKPANDKLRNRAVKILAVITGEGHDESEDLLKTVDWDLKKAVASFQKKKQ